MNGSRPIAFRVNAQKQVLHGCVAGGYNLVHLKRGDLTFLKQLGDEAVQRANDDLVQLGQAVLVEHRIADARK